MAESDGVHRGNLARLLGRVSEGGGIDLTQYLLPYVERRITARMRTLGLTTYRQYSAYLDEHPDEYAGLLDTLTINVTDFYRDASVCATIRRSVAPAIVRDKLERRQRLIRVWSAGCATGEEAYSIALTFLGALGDQARDFILTVIATDVDPKALEIGRRAEYGIEKLPQLLPADRRDFVEVRGDTFRFTPELTDHVKFRRLNLFEDKPIQVVDAIFCRNVFIYFSREQQERVLGGFWGALQRGGYLVLGKSEKMASSMMPRFELVDGGQRIYRKPLHP